MTRPTHNQSRPPALPLTDLEKAPVPNEPNNPLIPLTRRLLLQPGASHLDSKGERS